MIKTKLWLILIIVMTLGSSAYAGPDYPPELAKVVEKYPNGQVHMSARQEGEVNSAILAKGVTDTKTIFDFYKKALIPKDWKVDFEMENSMMAVMNFVKGGQLLIVGLMDHKQPQNEGMMITLTLQMGKDKPNNEATGTQPPASEQPPTPQPQPQEQGEYSDNQNGTITQLNAGLIWQQADDGQKRSWHSAVSYCQDLNLGGSTDWRLPEKNELARLKHGDEISIKDGCYWTTSHKMPGAITAWSVCFSESGGKPKQNNKALKYYVRCVNN